MSKAVAMVLFARDRTAVLYALSRSLLLEKNREVQGLPQRQVSDSQQRLQQALALHQRGMLSDAKRIYEDILKQKPDHFDALHLLGVIACQTNNLQEGEELFSQAIKSNPSVAVAYNNLGNALKDLKRFYESVANYDKAIALKPDYAEAYNNRGVALNGLKRLDEALASYDQAIALKRDYAVAYNNRGVALKDLKRPDEALASYDKAIALKPDYAEAYSNRGNALKDLKRPDEALASYDKAITLKPDYADAYGNLGNILNDLKRPDEALASYDKAIALKPDYAEAYNNRGIALQGLKRLDEALASYDKAIALKPDHAEAYNNRGNALQGLKRLDEALASYDKAIALKADHAEAYNNRGNALNDLKRPDEALASYDRAIALKPDHAVAYNNRGSALDDLKRLDEALASYDKAIALKPDYAEAYNNRGIALQGLKRLDEALASYDKAITLKPDYAKAYNNRGSALQDLKRPDEALASYDKAITLKPDYAEAYSNRGSAFKRLKRLDEALASYDRAIALNPDHAAVYSNRGSALKDLKRLDEALASYDKAISLKPDYAEAYANRGTVLQDLKRLDEALASYDRALSLDPDLVGAEGTRLYTKMRLCDWTHFDIECANLISHLNNSKANTPPFALLGISSSPNDQLQCAKLWIAEKYPASQKLIWQGARYRHNRIRIAYVSADLRQHPVSFLIAGMLECHDKSRFDVTGISLGPDESSEIRQRLKSAFEHFIDAETFGDEHIAKLVRSAEVDILVDLMGFTTDSRTGIFARRPAPIQINYLGFPGTMGAKYIDYILADRVVIPEEARECYSENAVYLPDSFMANDSKRKVSARLPRRSDCNLPETGFVFCSFNNGHKIVPETFNIWMSLLRQLDNGVLWLSNTNETAIRNLRREAQNRGVDPSRLVFAERVALNEDHLARHKLADLFLDTLPYNAHTSASDALWAGLPVLTCLGQTFAGRVAASLLNAIDLPELITTTPEAYEQMAIDLATHPDKLAIIKRKLAGNRLAAPLFNTRLYTRHIEAAYTAMYERHQAGLPPDHIIVPT
jgi:protein O-GlcNAc transferase